MVHDHLTLSDPFPAKRNPLSPSRARVIGSFRYTLFYLARFQTKVLVPPPEATGTITFSSSPVSVNGRLCSAPVEFGNVADSMRRTSLSPSTAYVPKWALVP